MKDHISWLIIVTLLLWEMNTCITKGKLLIKQVLCIFIKHHRHVISISPYNFISYFWYLLFCLETRSLQIILGYSFIELAVITIKCSVYNSILIIFLDSISEMKEASVPTLPPTLPGTCHMHYFLFTHLAHFSEFVQHC